MMDDGWEVLLLGIGVGDTGVLGGGGRRGRRKGEEREREGGGSGRKKGSVRM